MATSTVAEGRSARPHRSRLRRLSNWLIVLGVGVIIYAGVILAWGDPITWLWAHWQQRALRSELKHDVKQFEYKKLPPTNSGVLVRLRSDALTFRREVKEGHAFGSLTIPRMGLSDVVVVQGTTAGWDADLSKGPGHYMNTSFPGLGSTVAIAGHRTTYGAWFRNIDSMKTGDLINLQMPYATYHYRVQYHKVVLPSDWSIIKPQGYERLVLSACTPLYSASHRWIIFAKAVSVTVGKRTVPL
jgi:sortase A